MRLRVTASRWLPHLFTGWLFAEIAFHLLRRTNTGLAYDFPQFLAHMLSNRIYFLKNGAMALPYYTPAFAGGAPEYADPLDMHFSLVQWGFNLFDDPLFGLKTMGMLCTVLCYAGAYRLFRRLGVQAWPAAGGAFACSLNGYVTQHWAVGALNVQSYWAIPWIVLQAIELSRALSQAERIKAGLWLGALVSVTIYARGTYVLFFAALLCLSWWAAEAVVVPAPWKRWKERLPFLGLALVVSAALSASVLLATLEYRRQFPRIYPNEALGIARALWIPPQSLFNPTLHLESKIPLQVYGWWENGAYAGVITLLICIGGWIAFARRRIGGRSQDATVRLFSWWTFFATAAVLYLFVGWNVGAFVLKKLPILNSLHVPSRWVGALPFVWIGLAMAFVDFGMRYARRPVLMVALPALLAFDLLLFQASEKSRFSGKPDPQYPVDMSGLSITRWNPGDTRPETILAGEGDVKTYDPIFGYGGELVAVELDFKKPAGAKLPDGTYNVNDPVALLYPQETGKTPWSRLPADTPPEQVKAFLAFENPRFFVPAKQKAANLISAFSCLGVIGGLLVLYVRPRSRRQWAGETSSAENS
jgi:hypothetical protein